jgi:chromosome segregation ATPase
MRKAVLGAMSVMLLALPFCYGSPQQPSVAEAARKARAQKKNQPKSPKVVTNDDLGAVPGGVSVIGGAEVAAGQEASAARSDGAEKKTDAGGDTGAPPKEEKGEAYWRKRFAEARNKLSAAEKELDILQREFNLQQMQYYSDPNKALREQYERKDINDQRRKIDDKKKEIDQLRRTLSDLEDELRRAGGDSGWTREP